MLQPGELELDVRLGIQLIGEGEVPLRTQSLLTRSNVVSLTISDTHAGNNAQIHLLFSCVPRLRALHVRLLGYAAHALPRLGAPANDDTLPLLPDLESLCLSGGNVHQKVMDRVKEIVEARRLRSLVFSSCKFPASYDEQPNNAEHQGEGEGAGAGENEDADADADEDADGDEDEDVNFVPGEPEEYFKAIPECTKGWLSERVASLVVCETPAAST